MTDNTAFEHEDNPVFFSATQKQIAKALNLNTASISSRVSKIRSQGGFCDGAETSLRYQTSSGVYSVYFYDLMGIWTIIAPMSLKKPRTKELHFKLLSFVSRAFVCGLMDIQDDSDLEPLALDVVQFFLQTPNANSGRGGFVYLFRNEDGVHKIGITINLVKRQKQLELEHGPLELVTFIEAEDRFALERVLHTRYASKQYKIGHHVEWFSLDSDDVKHIIKLAVQS